MRVDVDTQVLESLLVLATVIEARDAYTGGHAWRVAKYAELLARDAGLDADQVFVVQLGGLVHDLGKVGVPDAVLNKPGRLDDGEMAAMRAHPGIGAGVIERHPLAPLVLAAVSGHHERPDGRGYPQANSAEPPYARIISIADAFDAMTSDRPYRKGMALPAAAAILEQEAGSQFDAALAKRFVALIGSGRLTHVVGHANDLRQMLACSECGLVIAPPADAVDGDHVACPVCTGDYVLHQAGTGFQPEWSGTMSGLKVPLPDRSAVQAIMRAAPHFVSL
ncbi:MAG: hypothetical protein A2087_02100 [Spirochaetes bacterium GWD1_61_31]|nr:MAG: hypothetical protein A2Y37_11835 [Spirochaetes bacterium GWB1_60_80]OHD35682.1 MAG: hypothetical protein A2004_02950 [Spirochaetes bacterium GWC1_61_12]OHD43814.1 MAG: hypothetical protein A2087_02100 [Spirochaetes bacterium GWD1_61_31]OHD46057.1 MAG: hypothetical protein A2Y35_13660 [Spirochaetes bacterium GWE1_60_18]OHD60629.1 MAG: hypothetical protein A2Y32_08150 [Spirochaetes bacterium GWF1_60_12]HAP44246.1 phosphohydrolase [Spirochaetaceae bacterium]